MATLPFSVQIRNGETLEQFQRRVQQVRAEYIHRNTKHTRRAQLERAAQLVDRNVRREYETKFCASLVKTVRAQWLAGLRIDDIACNWAMTPNNVRNLCHDWDRRADCIPSLQDVQLYRSVGFKRKLPDGPKLDARLTRWIAAVEAQARRNRPEHNRRRG